jgi:hypothetical protein
MTVERETAAREFDRANPLSRFVDVARRVALHPFRFYAEIPRQGGLFNPLLFAMICAAIGTILEAVLSLVGVGGTLGLFLDPFDASTGDWIAYAIGSLISLLVVVPIFLFIDAGIIHLLVRLIVGAGNSGFGATFRVVSYSSVVLLVSWIPFIGTLLNILVGSYLQFVGVRQMHETTTGRALAVILVNIAIYALVIVGLGWAVGMGASESFSTWWTSPQ